MIGRIVRAPGRRRHVAVRLRPLHNVRVPGRPMPNPHAAAVRPSRGADRRYLLAVQTADRPVPTLRATLDSLCRAGLSQWIGPAVVFADDCVPQDLPSGFQMETSPRRLGNVGNFMRIVHATASDETLDGVLLIEDDVLLSRNALPYVQSLDVPPDTASIALYSPLTSDLAAGMVKMPSSTWSGNCAILFTSTAVRRMAASNVAAKWPRNNGADEILSAVIGSDLGTLHHVPSLAQHVGDVSSMGHVCVRRSPTFRGEDFDALSLLP